MSKEENAKKIAQIEKIMNHVYDEMELSPQALLDRNLDTLLKADVETLLAYYDVIYLQLLKRGHKFK